MFPTPLREISGCGSYKRQRLALITALGGISGIHTEKRNHNDIVLVPDVVIKQCNDRVRHYLCVSVCFRRFFVCIAHTSEYIRLLVLVVIH